MVWRSKSQSVPIHPISVLKTMDTLQGQSDSWKLLVVKETVASLCTYRMKGVALFITSLLIKRIFIFSTRVNDYDSFCSVLSFFSFLFWFSRKVFTFKKCMACGSRGSPTSGICDLGEKLCCHAYTIWPQERVTVMSPLYVFFVEHEHVLVNCSVRNHCPIGRFSEAGLLEWM